jgi:hypothetical protein
MFLPNTIDQYFTSLFLYSGLSKEGWYITKNLLIELVIIMVGFFTFVPAIQVCCHYPQLINYLDNK